MNDRLDELKATLKTQVGRLIGNGQLERAGQVDLALARARRKTKGVLRQVGGTFKDGPDLRTHHERLVTQGKADGLHVSNLDAGTLAASTDRPLVARSSRPGSSRPSGPR